MGATRREDCRVVTESMFRAAVHDTERVRARLQYVCDLLLAYDEPRYASDAWDRLQAEVASVRQWDLIDGGRIGWTHEDGAS